MQAQNTTFIPDFKTLARTISLVENEANGFEQILESLRPADIPVIGFTGPPGAGKSTLLNAVIGHLLDEDKKIGLILIDPSSPFNLGAVLGDRLRMTAHFNNPDLFIRSVASRGSLGGLSDKIIEIVEVMRCYPFDYIFIRSIATRGALGGLSARIIEITDVVKEGPFDFVLVETVGVGQSEVEIAGLADTTVLVLVPEGGDSIQAMKAGLMEIADIYVVNKADRPDAEAMLNFLSTQLHINGKENIPVLKTVAVEGKGVKELIEAFTAIKSSTNNQERKVMLLADKALKIIKKNKMKGFDQKKLYDDLKNARENKGFNLYNFTKKYLSSGSL